MATIMKKLTSFLISGILLISILIMVNPVSADVYHVYESDGWQVLHDTIQGAPPGSTIYVHAGTYYIKDGIEFSASNLTIIGDSPFNTIIDATNAGVGNAISSTSSYTTMKNITIRNASGAGFYLDGNYVYIENCISHSNAFDGFVTDDYGTLKNCLAYDNTDGFDDNSHCTYINCTAANNSSDGFYDDYGGTKVINCIAVGNGDEGFDIEDDGDPSEITYSNAWGNTGGDYDEQGPGIGSISVDPKFATGRLGEYYLSIASPSVDSGSDESAALGLYNGFTTRTDEKWDKGTVDMGFHYASSRDPTGSIPIMKILEILNKNKN